MILKEKFIMKVHSFQKFSSNIKFTDDENKYGVPQREFKKFIKCLDEFLKFEDYLYHCTFKKNLDSILKNGLCLKYKGQVFSDSNDIFMTIQNAIYLTRDYRIVLAYEPFKSKLSEVIILKISLLELDMNKMYFDEDMFQVLYIALVGIITEINMTNERKCKKAYELLLQDSYKKKYINTLKDIFSELNKNDCENVYYSALGFIKYFFLEIKDNEFTNWLRLWRRTMLESVFKFQKYVKCFLYHRCKLDTYIKFFQIVNPLDNEYKDVDPMYRTFAYHGRISPKLIELVEIKK